MIGDQIAGVIGQIITRVWPDEQQKAAALLELERLKQAGEFKEIDAELERSRQQTEVNKVEAAHRHPFVAGWRPAIGWVGAAALAWHFIGRPVAVAISGAEVPEVDLGDLITIVGGMLGLGFARTKEKLAGVTR